MILIKPCTESESRDVVCLIKEMAESDGETSAVTGDYCKRFLNAAGCGILLAIDEDEVIGMLSFVVRPDLYHAADTFLIQEMFVSASARNRGAGTALLSEALRAAETGGCAEISVSVMPDNLWAQRLYKSMGLVEQAVLLEKHPQIDSSDSSSRPYW